MNFPPKKVAFAILGALSFYACTDDYFEFDKIKVDELRPEYAVPLINSSLTMEDILMNEDTAGVISTGSDGVLEILYEGNVISNLGATNVPLPNISETTSINSIPSPPPGTQVTIPTKDTITYSIQNGTEVDSLLLKEGKLALNFTSTVRHQIDVTVTFPGFRDQNGVILQKIISIPPYDGINPTVRATIETLDNYLIDFTLNGTSFNKIPFDIEATITGATGVPPGVTGNLQLTTEFRNLEFKEFNGYLGTEPIDLQEDTILIALFKNFDRGRFYLADPVLDIRVANSYGMPINLNFNYLDAITPDGPSPKKAIDLGANNPISLLYPTKYGTEYTNVRLNNTNSNIPEIISDLLKEIAFDADAHPNPAGNLGHRHFFSDTSGIGLDVKLRLPLTGYASGFTLEDTVDFEFDIADELESGLVRTRVSNGFPLEGKLQLIFADENYNKLDSLFSNGQQSIIPAAPINSDGRATDKVDQNTDAILTTQKLKKIKDSKYLLLRAELETTNGASSVPDTVKFLPEYKLDVAIGLKASILID